MPDMRDALGRVGLKAAGQPERRGGGPPQGGRGDPARTENQFPPEYPKYFDEGGHTRVDLILREAQERAACFQRDDLKRHQLRAFYDHAKRQLQRLNYGVAFAEIHPEIARLKVFAADRAGRSASRLPRSFKDFIDRNVDAVSDEKSFSKGFMPHFEAVVGYCAGIKDR